MEKLVRDFVASVQPDDTALFFYCGHGIQIENTNYLVPTDFNAVNAVEAKHKAYSAQLLAELMESSGAKLNIIILDACRNDPFAAARGALCAVRPGKGGASRPQKRKQTSAINGNYASLSKEDFDVETKSGLDSTLSWTGLTGFLGLDSKVGFVAAFKRRR
jgi:uncharacterized caspase-like protein